MLHCDSVVVCSVEWGTEMQFARIATFSLALGLLTGCAEEFMVLHSQTGEPLIISRRSYSFLECVGKLRQDAARMGATFRYVHVRGTTVGRSLLWPFERGYACEGALGPEQRPSGTYPIDLNILTRQLSNPVS
jgi:hypothetical protein